MYLKSLVQKYKKKFEIVYYFLYYKVEILRK